MLKKICILLIIFALTTPCTNARIGQPTFVFAINDVPASSSTKDKDGLSGGAVTAITLGSIGGAALLGLGGWLYKRKAEQHLAAGCVRGSVNPLVPFCIEEEQNSEFYARINKNYPYLKKALSLNEIHYCPHTKYLLIYDTSIERKTFDSVKFNLPQGVRELKITHVTDPFEKHDLTAELFLFKTSTTSNQPDIEVLNNKANEKSESAGIIQKTITVNTSIYNSAVYVISNYSDKKIYAVVFEFIF